MKKPFIVVIAILSFISESALTKDIATCETEKGSCNYGSYRDCCIYGVISSSYSKIPEDCDKISSQDIKDMCLDSVAGSAKNIAICDKIKGTQGFQCTLLKASRDKSYEVCKSFKRTHEERSEADYRDKISICLNMVRDIRGDTDRPIEEPYRDPCIGNAEKQVTKYLDIWKSLFSNRNSIDDKYFKEHIAVDHTNVICWDEGISLQVFYNVTIDWAKIAGMEKFPIAGKDRRFLEENEIKNPNKGMAYELSTFTPHKHLLYKTEKEAEKTLSEALGGEITNKSYRYYVPGMAPRTNGDPYLLMDSKKDERKNLCAHGSLNLITGVTKAQDTACWVN
jgi:hypothetical protein